MPTAKKYNPKIITVIFKLTNNKKAGDVDVAFANKFTKMYNEENCKALNIEIPEGYSKLETKSE